MGQTYTQMLTHDDDAQPQVQNNPPQQQQQQQQAPQPQNNNVNDDEPQPRRAQDQTNNINVPVEAAAAEAVVVDTRPHFATCRHCTKPIFPFTAILAERIAVWSDQVYTYQLEDVLGEGSVVNLYSATNPGAHRFDVFRVQMSGANEWRDVTLKVDTSRFTPHHTWFPGFSWCMIHCANCSAHLGWGFSPTQRGDKDLDDNDDDEEAADGGEGEAGNEEREQEERQQQPRQDQQEQQQQPVQAAADEQQPQQQAERQQDNRRRDRQEDPDQNQQPEAQQQEPRWPVFMGCIFANIRPAQLSDEEWQQYLKQQSSVTHRSGLSLIHAAWPATHDMIRHSILQGISSILRLGDPALVSRGFSQLMRQSRSILSAAASFTQRVRQRQQAGEQIEQHGIPLFRQRIEDGEDYVQTEEEKEDTIRRAALMSGAGAVVDKDLVLVQLLTRFRDRRQEQVSRDVADVDQLHWRLMLAGMNLGEEDVEDRDVDDHHVEDEEEQGQQAVGEDGAMMIIGEAEEGEEDDEEEEANAQQPAGQEQAQPPQPAQQQEDQDAERNHED